MSTTTTATSTATEPEVGFDFAARVEELRRHETGDVREVVRRARREQQRWHLEELAATRVLDDRGALDRMPDPTVSTRTAKTNLELARELESLPEIAAAAAAGDLTWDQLQPVVALATPETDAEWAQRGANAAVGDLSRMARRNRVVSAAEAAERHDLRSVFSWHEAETGMSAGRWRLPDVEGVLVDKVLEHMAEQMRPEKGQPWDSLAHRKADALVALARDYADVEPTGRFRFEIVTILTPDGAPPRAEVGGIPLAPETVAALRPQARVRECRVDAETGRTTTVKRPRPALPRDVELHVKRRDLSCRVPGCSETRGLQIHHLNPRCFAGDTDDPAQLANVCPHHHHLLEPHGPYRLVGDANDAVGLRLVHRDEQPRDGPSP
jgi:hypothetical protein